MNILKRFAKYLILLVLLYVVVTVLTAGMIAKTYTASSSYEILANSEEYDIKINSAKNTSINGYVEGTITNNTDSLGYEQYLKISYYSKENNYLGTDYVDLGSFQKGTVKEFKSIHKYYGVESFTIDIVDKKIVDTEKDYYNYMVENPFATGGFWGLVTFFTIMWVIYII